MKNKINLKDKLFLRVLCYFGIHRYSNILKNVIFKCEDCGKLKVIR